MAFDSEGIMQVAPLIDKGGYVVLDLYSFFVTFVSKVRSV